MDDYENRISKLGKDLEYKWVNLLDAINTASLYNGESEDNYDILKDMARVRGDRENPLLQQAKEWERLLREIGGKVRTFLVKE